MSGPGRPRRPKPTPRQGEIVRLLNGGLNQKEVAAKLGISLRTVEMHLRLLRVKTGARNTLGALAVMGGFVEPGEPLATPVRVAVSDPATVSRRLRFQVLQRDNFTCRYCGRAAPDVVLEVDHVVPRSAGGSNALSNLVTSCLDCNQGKGPLSIGEPTT